MYPRLELLHELLAELDRDEWLDGGALTDAEKASIEQRFRDLETNRPTSPMKKRRTRSWLRSSSDVPAGPPSESIGRQAQIHISRFARPLLDLFLLACVGALLARLAYGTSMWALLASPKEVRRPRLLPESGSLYLTRGRLAASGNHSAR